jgi:hypothetical protein
LPSLTDPFPSSLGKLRFKEFNLYFLDNRFEAGENRRKVSKSPLWTQCGRVEEGGFAAGQTRVQI